MNDSLQKEQKGRPIFSQSEAVSYWMKRNSAGFDMDTGEPLDTEPSN